MTEKRFNNNGTLIFDNKTPLNTFEVVDKLNELHEENEQLKKEIENGIESFKKIQRCHTLTLVEENEQLKNNIKEAYENERTALGRSVLKQLIDKME